MQIDALLQREVEEITLARSHAKLLANLEVRPDLAQRLHSILAVGDPRRATRANAERTEQGNISLAPLTSALSNTAESAEVHRPLRFPGDHRTGISESLRAPQTKRQAAKSTARRIIRHASGDSHVRFESFPAEKTMLDFDAHVMPKDSPPCVYRRFSDISG